jgi:hypothetical protein
MTRRDRCRNCEELVYDMDVSCNECYISLHSECATTYDAASRWAIFVAKVETSVNYHPTMGDLRRLSEDNGIIESILVRVADPAAADDTRLDVASKEELRDLIWMVRYDEDDVDEDDEDKDLQKQPIRRAELKMMRDCKFICYICHQGIYVRY